MEKREITIDVPWGKLAIVLWGNENDQPVLSVHGKLDNAATFNALIPLLPKYYFYICIDLPGHGKSDHFPAHLPIFTSSYLIVYKLVMDYFKKPKYIIMGHSYGGQLGLKFAQIYPSRVEKLIMFDTVHLFTMQAKYYAQEMENHIEEFVKTERKLQQNSAPQYTYEEAVKKLCQSRPSPLPAKAAEILLQRMLKPVNDGKFQFSHDQRLKCFINPQHDSQYAIETLKSAPVKCPVLIVFGLDNGGQRMVLRPILNHLKKLKNVRVEYLPGHHDIHLTDADKVAPIVNEFLNYKTSKL
ncbi:unnamed protein product [Ceutorhynchus assimilis]|uniref:AB hydrolase-1 domain-containing protein n=1 Tax=Ceutorhynchus assimilis TaxID=467358 RepID=A0A9N9MGZ1_9CUCU|nr:unnamed protein product [Ceutorhynchus assimilis]